MFGFVSVMLDVDCRRLSAPKS